MRKPLLALAAGLFAAGLTLAAEYTVVKFDKDTKVVTLKDKDGKEVTARLTDKTKATIVDPDGNKRDTKIGKVEKMLTSDKAVGAVLNATVEKDEVTEVTIKGKKKV